MREASPARARAGTFLAPWPDRQDMTTLMGLERPSDGVTVAERIEGAFTRAARRRGLLGRNSMPPGTALVIAPCRAVHTFFMRFAIDVLFVARDGTIRKIVPCLGARRLAASAFAYAAIELPAGAAEDAGLVVGDILAVTRRHSS